MQLYEISSPDGTTTLEVRYEFGEGTRTSVHVVRHVTPEMVKLAMGEPRWAALKMMALVTQRSNEGACAADFAFVEYRWRGGERAPLERQLQPKTFYRRFKRYVRAAGLPETITPHSGRATAITKLLSDGVPHREVQEFSRHRMIQSVEWYDKRRN